MKIIYYSKEEQKVLTDSEFEDAKRFFAKGKKYFCERTNDFISPGFKFTSNRSLEGRFIPYIMKSTKKRFMHDFVNNRYYELQDGMTFELAYENIIKRENGEDAPNYGLYPQEFSSDDEVCLMKKNCITEDEYIDQSCNSFFLKEIGELSESINFKVVGDSPTPRYEPQDRDTEILEQKMIQGSSTII